LTALAGIQFHLFEDHDIRRPIGTYMITDIHGSSQQTRQLRCHAHELDARHSTRFEPYKHLDIALADEAFLIR